MSARQLDLGVKAVEGIMDHRLAPVVDWAAFAALETLGIDEVALCKGHGQYVAVIWARDALSHTHVLAVLPDRLQATVQAFLEGIPTVLKTTIRRVCMDMWDGYAGAVVAALPQIVVDRFHVAVQYRNAVDEVRKQECHRIVPPANGGPGYHGRTAARWCQGGRPDPDLLGQLVELFEQTRPW